MGRTHRFELVHLDSRRKQIITVPMEEQHEEEPAEQRPSAFLRLADKLRSR